MPTRADLKNLTRSLQASAQLSDVLNQLGSFLQQIAGCLAPERDRIVKPASKPLLDLINEVLLSKAGACVRERYLVQLRHSLEVFSRGRLDRSISTITAAEIQEYLSGGDWAAATRLSYLTDLRTMFNFAVRRGYLTASPANGVDRPLLEDSPPFVHSPEEVRTFLHTAQRMDKDVMRLYAIQYFGGPRPLAEAAMLEEKHLLPGLVEVEGPRAKTRRRRLLTITPALRAFLKVGGKLPVVNLKKRWLAVRKEAGIEWGPDATRDSFCSYHLAHYRDAARTALEAGHSQQILFSKYRAVRTHNGELITRKLAREFWGIRPA